MSVDVSRRDGRLFWFVRHYAWVVVAVVCALAAAPLLVAPATPTYQAEALVVAQQLGVNTRVLPQLAHSVFEGGAVEARVAADAEIEDGGGDLIPQRLSVVAGEDSVALVVQARDPDPAAAARLADLAATAYVDELNRSGAGVGTFSAQAPAVVPTEPLSTLSTPARVGLGAAAGLLLAIGLVALLATFRRPVLTYRDVEEVTGVPLLGTIELPRRQDGYAGPRGVRGIATVTRWLATVPSGRLMFVSSPPSAPLRQRVFVMVAIGLRTMKPVRLEASPDLQQAVEQHRPAARDGRRDDGPAGELVLVDGGSPLDVMAPTAADLTVVVVAPLGIPRRELRALASDYTDGGLAGIVLVDGSARQGTARQERAAATTAPIPKVRPTGEIWEPERA